MHINEQNHPKVTDYLRRAAGGGNGNFNVPVSPEPDTKEKIISLP
jgi:hypothetical protein